jgi:hypothetical protein
MFSYFVNEFFTVTVNYRQSLEDMIKAGNYDKVNKDITEKFFPFERQSTIDTGMNIIKFGADMTSKEIFKLFQTYNLRPANAPELLAFGAKYPHKQKSHTIIALNDSWKMILGNATIINPKEFAILRTLTMCKSVSKWDRHTKFLAVSK